MGLGEWLDAQLFERRIVTLTGPLDDGAATRAAGALTALDAGGAEPIELHLDSPDGALGAAFLVIDTVGLLRAPVRVRCRGQVGGPAIGILAAAERRMAGPHAAVKRIAALDAARGGSSPKAGALRMPAIASSAGASTSASLLARRPALAPLAGQLAPHLVPVESRAAERAEEERDMLLGEVAGQGDLHAAGPFVLHVPAHPAPSAGERRA